MFRASISSERACSAITGETCRSRGDGKLRQKARLREIFLSRLPRTPIASDVSCS